MVSQIIAQLAASCLFAFLNIRALVTVCGLSPVKWLETFGTLLASLGKLTEDRKTLGLGDGAVCKLFTLYT